MRASVRPQSRRLGAAAFFLTIFALGVGATAATVELGKAHADPGRPARPLRPPAPPQIPAQPQPQLQQPVVTPGQPAQPADAAIDVATRLGDAFAGVAARVSPSVVNIQVEVERPRQELPFQFGPFGQMPGGQGDGGIARGEGSGIIISADGAILTNNHVVDDARRIQVRLRDGRTLRATLVGSDPATDLAVIRVTARGLPAARFANSDTARPGEWVVAVGSPFGLDYTVTAGVLSAVGRGGLGQSPIEDYLQTDASINPGNSGGPLVNLHGEILGINTMIVGRGTGIGFAIPANLARGVSDQLLATGVVRRSWLGVGFQELTPELASSLGSRDRHGALVNQIVPAGPSARAGLRPGDIVTSIDGRPIGEGRDLLRTVLRERVGARLRLGLLREGRAMDLEVVTDARPEDRPAQAPTRPNGPHLRQQGLELGLQLQSLTPMIRQQAHYTGTGSVVVVGVEEGSAADRAGLQPGDVVMEVDRQPVTRAEQLGAAMRDGSALVRVERRSSSFFTILERD